MHQYEIFDDYTCVGLLCYQVKQKSLMSQEVRMIKLKEQASELQKTNKLPASAADKLVQLHDRWTSTNQRLSKWRFICRSEVRC